MKLFNLLIGNLFLSFGAVAVVRYIIHGIIPNVHRPFEFVVGLLVMGCIFLFAAKEEKERKVTVVNLKIHIAWVVLPITTLIAIILS